MAHYVMVVAKDDTYFFVGPFATECDACAWGTQQDDVHPSWHVIEMDHPGAAPRILPPTVQTIASGDVRYVIPPEPGGRGLYVLCFNPNSYHLVGPFGSSAQMMQFINLDDENEGPYRSLDWYPLLLDVPPGSPMIVPPHIPVEM